MLWIAGRQPDYPSASSRIDHPDWVAVRAGHAGLEGKGEIPIRELVKQPLRMRRSVLRLDAAQPTAQGDQ
jgi:hypothetical protein